MLEKAEKLLDCCEIKQAIYNCAKQLAKQINPSKQYTVIVLMNGAFKFAADLLSNIALQQFNFEIHFVKTTRKQDANKFILETDFELLQQICKNKDVIVIDDVYDSGTTILTLNKQLKDITKSLLFVVLLAKTKPVIDNILVAQYVETNKWLFGYGMDYENKYRHLNSIYAI